MGTLTRTVKDAAYLLSKMAGRSDRDERSWEIPFDAIPDFSTFCKGKDLNGITVGVPRNTWIGDSPAPIEASFNSALETMRSAGAKVLENADFPKVEGFKKLNMEVKGVVRSSEFKRDIVNYIQTLETNPNNLHSAEDIIEFTKSFPAEDYPEKDIGKFLWSQAEGVNVESERYRELIEQEKYFGGEGGILGAMEKHDLDVIVVPANQDIANDLAVKMGFPAISVPLGFWPEDTPIDLDEDKPNLVTVGPGMP